MNSVSQARVMVVDDVPESVLIISDILEGLCRVITPASNMSIMESVAQQSPDLLLLDVLMPGLDGFAICGALKRDPSTAHIPVIFLTGLSDPDDKLTGFSVGGVDYITKPFQAAEVRARVLTHLKLFLSEREQRQSVKYFSNALEHTEESYLFFAEHTADILVQADAQEIITLVNSTWTEVTGSDRGGVMQHSILEIVDERDRGNFVDALKRAQDGRAENLHMQLRLPSKDGFRWMRASFRMRYGPSGEYLGLTGVFTDIDDLMNESEALRASSAAAAANMEFLENIVRRSKFLLEKIFDGIARMRERHLDDAEMESLKLIENASGELAGAIANYTSLKASVLTDED